MAWRRAIVVLAAAALMFATAGVASAEVLFNGRFTFTATRLNTCAPADGPIVVEVTLHSVVREGPDGTRHVHNNLHGSGLSANGTRYVFGVIEQDRFDPSTSTVSFRTRLLSQGGSDNLHSSITFTLPDGSSSFELDCRG